MSDPSLRIDLEKIVNGRGGKGRVPAFVINWGKKFIHQDLINSYLEQGYEGVEFCENCMKALDVTINVEGMENLDGFADDVRFTFASNHPLGGIDGVALGMVFGKRFDGKVKYLVNDILMNVKGLAPMCVPINKLGGQARDLPRLIDEAFASENHMIIFPAGKCSRKIDGKIQDTPWGKTFITRSIRTGRHIVPVHFIGQNSPRFYRIDRICKALKIKFNIPMLFLPDEMVRGMHGAYTVRIGKPIPPEHFDSSRSAVEWAEWLRQLVYTI